MNFQYNISEVNIFKYLILKNMFENQITYLPKHVKHFFLFNIVLHKQKYNLSLFYFQNTFVKSVKLVSLKNKN